MKYIDGGVCSAKGFRAGGMNCGIKAGSTKKDLAMIVSDTMCSAAAVYTTNKVKGAPLAVTREHLINGTAQAVICNSGNANTCAPMVWRSLKKHVRSQAAHWGWQRKISSCVLPGSSARRFL